MICPTCGNNIDENKCPNCGTFLNNNVQINNNVENKPVMNNNKENNKKLIGIILGIIVIIIIILVVIFVILNLTIKGSNESIKKNNNVITKISNVNELVLVEKNELYGVVNLNGDIILETKYEDVGILNDNYFYVLIDNGDLSYYSILDKDGNEVDISGLSKENITSVNYDDTYDEFIINGILYDKTFNKISDGTCLIDDIYDGYYSCLSDDYYGIIDYNGKLVYKDSSYSLVQNLNYDKRSDNSYCVLINDSDNSEVINCDTGKVIQEYVSIGNYSDTVVSNTYLIDDNFYYFYNDHILYDLKVNSDFSDYYDYYTYNDDYAIIYENDNKRYLNLITGEVIDSEPSVDKIYKTDNGTYQIYKDNDLYGIKKDGEITVKAKWSDISFLFNEAETVLSNNNIYYALCNDEGNNKSYLVDMNSGKKVFNFEQDYASVYVYDFFVTYTNTENFNTMIYSLLNGKTFEIKDYSDDYSYEINEFSFAYYLDNSYFYYNYNFDKIY